MKQLSLVLEFKNCTAAGLNNAYAEMDVLQKGLEHAVLILHSFAAHILLLLLSQHLLPSLPSNPSRRTSCIQVAELEAQEVEAGNNVLHAEDVANTAMKAAERAVREEMEAAAVTKETKKALEKAITDLKELGISFAQVDDRTANERARLQEQKKVDHF